jgi:hypothetical protein
MDIHARNGVDHAKYEMGRCKYPHVPHCLAEGWFHNAVSHADNEQQEERERVSRSIENRNQNHKGLGSNIGSMDIFVIVVSPSQQHLDNQENQDCRDVILDRKDIVSILDIEESPEDTHDRVHERHSTVEGQFGNLSGSQLSIGVPECNDSLVVNRVSEAFCGNAVVSGLRYLVMSGIRRFRIEVDGLGDDLVDGLVAGTWRYEIVANISIVTDL